jgi:hypothetical protein
MPEPDPGLSLQVDSRGLSLYLINGAPGNRTNVYRLDDLDDFPRLSERDRAMVMGLLEGDHVEAGCAAVGGVGVTASELLWEAWWALVAAVAVTLTDIAWGRWAAPDRGVTQRDYALAGPPGATP